ncbi:MAG: phosphatidylserine decarboxylase [Rhodospirillales bacterium]
MPRNPLAATVLIPVHPAGWPFVGALAALAFVLLFVGWGWAVLVALLALFTAFFFRDPERQTPIRQGLIISPGDGRVIAVQPVVPPAELALTDKPLVRVSIFLSIFDVHINRAPIDGVVVRRIHTPGSFSNAAFLTKSDANERQSWLIAGEDGPPVAVVQIAGLIARRILGWVAEGAHVKAGQRIGMIRFGSRVDVYLPDGMVPLVAVGQRMIGGETVIADARANEPPRPAAVR